MIDYMSPSLICSDLLNLANEISVLEEAKVDMLHIDIADTTFIHSIAFPISLIPKINAVTSIPLDIHIMIDKPERVIDQVLPHCAGAFISLHIEATDRMRTLMHVIKQAGGHTSVALNVSTPICMIEELVPMLDMILVLTSDVGSGIRLDLDNVTLEKVRDIRRLCNEKGKSDMLISVDGGISFENAKKTKQAGANVFVLGTTSIYKQQEPVLERCKMFREYIKQI